MFPSFGKSLLRWLCSILILTSLPVEAAVREIATISTSMGDMEFELFSGVSSRNVANFKYLADTKFYDNTAFHRQIKGFMVQGGCPLTRGTTVGKYEGKVANYGNGGPEYTIPDEPTSVADYSHVRGVLSMAKTKDADSGGSQFFIVFGNATHLDPIHAPMGRITKGAEVLDAIENRSPVSGILPDSPIVISSVRIRAEKTEDDSVPRMRFQPGTLGGLLRTVDRNLDVCGSYQLTVTRGGAFSAQIQYYGRRKAFTGVLLQGTTAVPEADYVGKIDPTAAVPLRVRLHARQTAASKTSFVLQVGGINPDGSDLLDATVCIGAGEVALQSTLAERYTAALYAPLEATSASTTGPLYPDVKGAGYLAINVRSATGLAFVTGRLQDNLAITLARPVSNEGGRLLLPLFHHELQQAFESRRADFPDVPLADWRVFNFGVLRFRLVGSFELPPKPSLPQPVNAPGSYAVWYREPKTVGPVRSTISAFVPVVTAAWTPPVPGETLLPFVPGAKAQFSADSLLNANFQISKTNAAGVFDPSAGGPQLWLNPVDGTFRGSFIDASRTNRPRRSFQGVLLQKQGLNRGSGFVLTESGSLPISLNP